MAGIVIVQKTRVCFEGVGFLSFDNGTGERFFCRIYLPADIHFLDYRPRLLHMLALFTDSQYIDSSPV